MIQRKKLTNSVPGRKPKTEQTTHLPMIKPQDAPPIDEEMPSSRGDSPALEVLNQIELQKLIRSRDDTGDQLKRVLARVDHTMATYEMFSVSRNVEFVSDVGELFEILKDDWKKHQYEHQVTVFIVGYEKTCDSRLALIRSVNEFFSRHSNLMSDLESILADKKPAPANANGDAENHENSNKPVEEPFDEDASMESFENALTTTKQLGAQLAELNQSIISYLTEQQESHPNANTLGVGVSNRRLSAIDAPTENATTMM